jgi:hypothetical protein
VDTVINFRVLYMAGNLTNSVKINLSRRTLPHVVTYIFCNIHGMRPLPVSASKRLIEAYAKHGICSLAFRLYVSLLWRSCRCSKEPDKASDLRKVSGSKTPSFNSANTKAATGHNSKQASTTHLPLSHSISLRTILC